EANETASLMLDIPGRFLVGKPLIAFVTDDQRWVLRRLLRELRTPATIRDAFMRFQPRKHEAFVAAVTVGQIVDAAGRVTGLRWRRLGAVAGQLGIAAVLCAPVTVRGDVVSAVTVVHAAPRDWSQADVGAIRAYAAVLAGLLAPAARRST